MKVNFKGEVHEHEITTGPYDSTKPLTCPKCIEWLSNIKAELCAKYGWSKWPFGDH